MARLKSLLTRMLLPLFFSALLTSCSGVLGYGVLLWNQEAYNLADNIIVPIYVKSSILKVYVIAVPGTGEKIEVPIWQVSEPKSRRAARALQRRYAEYAHHYAQVLSDGLPVRDAAVSTARQVYRLRKGEIVRILYKGEGAAVIAGDGAVEGEWYRILTQDGTMGWCFSRYLQIYDAGAADRTPMGATPENLALVEEAITDLFSRTWYPEIYKDIIASGNIDLTLLDPSQGFSVDRETMTAYIKILNFSGGYPFTGISQSTSASYTLDDSPLIITPRGGDMLIVSYENSRGLPVSHNFVTLTKDKKDMDINEVINEERERRRRIYNSFVRLGPRFGSDRYGTITFNGTTAMAVEWTGSRRPAFVGGQAEERGQVSFNYFLSDRMRTLYDGVVTFTFPSSSKENNFFYHLMGNTLRLEAADTSAPPDNTFTSRGTDPVVMLFSPDIDGSGDDSGLIADDTAGDADDTSADEP